MKACPFCAEEIQEAAIKCRHCGSDLLSPAVDSRPSAPTGPTIVKSDIEKTIYEGGLHWIVFRRPALWLAVALLATTGPSPSSSTVFWIIGIVDLVARLTLRSNTKFLLTTRRLSLQTGVLRKRSVELLLNKVESIAVSEPYFGQKFGYGTIVVGGTGGTKESFPMVPDPQAFRKLVQDLAHV